MTAPIEWARLIFNNWGKLIIFLPLLGYSGFKGYGDIQEFREQPEVKVTVEVPEHKDTGLTPIQVQTMIDKSLKPVIQRANQNSGKIGYYHP